MRKPPGKRGRPSEYSEKIAAEICRRLSGGQSLNKICSDKHMPDRSTVMSWCENDDDFSRKYARAREAQAEFLADEIIDLSDKVTPKNANKARIQIDARKWKAAKMAPRKFGDRIDVNPDADRPMNRKSSDATDAVLALLIQKGATEEEVIAALRGP